MGGPTTPYARVAADISDSTPSGRIALTGSPAQGASALGLGVTDSVTFGAAALTSASTATSVPLLTLASAAAATGTSTTAARLLKSGYGVEISGYLTQGVGGGARISVIAGAAPVEALRLDTNLVATFAGPIVGAAYTVSTLPAGTPGAMVYASNARKLGEASGAGTGVMAYFSNGSWRRLSDDSVLAA